MERHRERSGAPADPEVAVMQGRLSPPIDDQLQAFPGGAWQEEFGRAAEAEMNAIEWIFDRLDNPLLSSAAPRRLAELTRDTGVLVRSVCADYFMDAPLIRADASLVAERLATLRSLLERCRELGIRHIVLPFVDQSAIRERDDHRQLTDVLRAAGEHAVALGVELHLETSLGPDEFASLLAGLPAIVRANYDSGNSASLGYDVREEFAAYGARVGSVHIKDRRRGAGSVVLGSGDADFVALFECLTMVGYRGLYTLQVARGPKGEEVSWARRNRDFVMRHIRAATAVA